MKFKISLFALCLLSNLQVLCVKNNKDVQIITGAKEAQKSILKLKRVHKNYERTQELVDFMQNEPHRLQVAEDILDDDEVLLEQMRNLSLQKNKYFYKQIKRKNPVLMSRNKKITKTLGFENLQNIAPQVYDIRKKITKKVYTYNSALVDGKNFLEIHQGGKVFKRDKPYWLDKINPKFNQGYFCEIHHNDKIEKVPYLYEIHGPNGEVIKDIE